MNEVKSKNDDFKQLMDFSSSLAELDFRKERCKIHYAETIVFISLAAVICGAETWNDIEDFGKSKECFFAEKLPRFNGVPSHDTISRFFGSLSAEGFENKFREWIRDIISSYKGHLAIDGKTICGAGAVDTQKLPRGSRLKPSLNRSSKLHMVSVYATELGISLGQIKTKEKSNEITAIPELLDSIDIKGCTITIDAMGCQRAIAEKIIDKGGNYLLIVKDNQRLLKQAIESVMPGEIAKRKAYRFDTYETSEKGHGRIETRICYSCGESSFLGSKGDNWKGIKTFGYIENHRQVIGEKESTERRFFISSLPNDASEIMKTSREHWKIENGLHWQLDVNFNEDYTRKRNVAAQNFSLLNKIALAILKNNSTKKPINRKRKVAGWDNDFLWQLLMQDL